MPLLAPTSQATSSQRTNDKGDVLANLINEVVGGGGPIEDDVGIN